MVSSCWMKTWFMLPRVKRRSFGSILTFLVIAQKSTSLKQRMDKYQWLKDSLTTLNFGCKPISLYWMKSRLWNNFLLKFNNLNDKNLQHYQKIWVWQLFQKALVKNQQKNQDFTKALKELPLKNFQKKNLILNRIPKILIVLQLRKNVLPTDVSLLHNHLISILRNS